jgi:hypothetical protein
MKSYGSRNKILRFALASALTGLGGLDLLAQASREYIMRGAPYPVFSNPEPAKYNLKLGRLTARLTASTQVEFNDNINLSDKNPEGDISFGPDIGIGFLYPVTKDNVLQFDIGFGYRWYLNHPSVQSLTVAPNSRFDHRLYLEDVQIDIHDSFSVQNDPTSRPDISAVGTSSTTGNPIDFQRINNDAGLIAEWRPQLDWGLTAGYDYILDRSLNNEFTSIDRDTHSFSGGVNYNVSPRWTVGLNSSYSMTFYDQKIQNDGSGYSVGPRITYKPTHFLTIEAGVSYAVSSFEQTGTIADTSEFTGITAMLSIRHRINSSFSHYLNFTKDRELGLGSNFNEIFSAQYGFNYRFTSAIALNTTLVYENFSSSAATGEAADRYLVYLGTSYQITRLWSVSVAYAFGLKFSDAPDRNYLQNRLTLELARKF